MGSYFPFLEVASRASLHQRYHYGRRLAWGLEAWSPLGLGKRPEPGDNSRAQTTALGIRPLLRARGGAGNRKT